MPGVALPHAILGEVCDLIGSTARTLNLSVRPAELHHQLVAVVVIGEVDDGFLECVYAVHEPIIGLLAWYVKYIIT